jgi:hypothetical protein
MRGITTFTPSRFTQILPLIFRVSLWKVGDEKMVSGSQCPFSMWTPDNLTFPAAPSARVSDITPATINMTTTWLGAPREAFGIICPHRHEQRI